MGKLKNYFNYVISFNAIVTVSAIAIAVAVVYYLNYTSTTGSLWGISQATIYLLLYGTCALIAIILYLYNAKKSGWSLAILNVFIELVAAVIIAPFLVIYAIIRIINLVLGGGQKASGSPKSIKSTKPSKPSKPSSSTQPTVPTKGKSVIRPYYSDPYKTWVYKDGKLEPYYSDPYKTWLYKDGKLEPYYSDTKKTWVYKDGKLEPYYSDPYKTWLYKDGKLEPYYSDTKKTWLIKGGKIQPYYSDVYKTWVIEGDIPIPVIAKAVGII